MASNSKRGSTLTETQEELLQSAAHEGYFKVPREITLVDLAEIHGISDKETSQQLRRGLDVIVRDATLDGQSEDHPNER